MTSLILFFVLQAHAAVMSSSHAVSATELLSMPDANRIQVAKTRAMELYPEFIQIAFTEGKSVQARWKALITAAQINPNGAANDLNRALKHKDWFMRNAALVSLRSINPRLAEKAALSLISDKALIVRSAAVGVIPDFAQPETRTALWAEMRADYNFHKGESLWVREEILEKLAIDPQKHEYSYFASALQDRDEKLAGIAIMALEKLTHKKIGNAKTSDEQKKKLWVKYTKEHSVIK